VPSDKTVAAQCTKSGVPKLALKLRQSFEVPVAKDKKVPSVELLLTKPSMVNPNAGNR
jgi:hypothetical protein